MSNLDRRVLDRHQSPTSDTQKLLDQYVERIHERAKSILDDKYENWLRASPTHMPRAAGWTSLEACLEEMKALCEIEFRWFEIQAESESFRKRGRNGLEAAKALRN